LSHDHREHVLAFGGGFEDGLPQSLNHVFLLG
jgi:hypothetical protein